MAIVVVVVFAVMWIYVLFIAGSNNDNDTLDAATFPAAAEPVCASARTQLGNLGLVNQVAATPQARANLVDKTDDQLRLMVQKLRGLVPPPSNDATAITKWLDDWDQWLRDRGDWSVKLHAGQDAPFLEKQRSDGSPNSKALDAFATANNMGDCTTPVGV
ncbi:MAG TPA: hypothetical protein VGZ52_07620 [Acidimicrobiales bacterium]|nr:hypothetical protein [Acidimicrobiales bacterium]